MKTAVLALALALSTAACATTNPTGVRDPDEFRRVAQRTVIESALPYADVARCFEDRAALLPMSSFIADEAAERTTYRLRGFGYTFEEIAFEAAPGGSRATVLMAPNLNTRWREDFARDRGAALALCATGKR
ncbi:MAG: hypothetical protein NW200_15440 [Hyphomonadaceae bacterium]|nr:hypothetical protein [Hyphomonadaceae bacterium]